MEKPLFEELEALADEMAVSRSRLISLAAQEFIERYKSRKLLEAMNAALDGLPDQDDEELMIRMKSRHREIVKDQW
jgi:metal-responsive CopG/Arc/MetJ family transcriptional regulator